MIDIVDLPYRFTLFDYLTRARRILEDVVARGRVPFIVGGTPLYAEAIIRGYILQNVRPSKWERQTLEARSNEDLVCELETLFPGEAARIGISNHRRLVRAVERARQGYSYEATHQTIPRYQWLIFGVTWPMPELESRIRDRLERRLRAGMVEEVVDALHFGLTREVLWNLGLEYRFVLKYLEGEFGTEAEFVDALARAIRRFAKRQLAWFRRWPDIIWTEGTLEERMDRIVATTNDWLVGR